MVLTGDREILVEIAFQIVLLNKELEYLPAHTKMKNLLQGFIVQAILYCSWVQWLP